MKSATLAGWPMLGVAIWSAGVWILLASFCLRPAGMDVAIWWPAVLVAALGTTLQALLWAPVRFGVVRMALAILVPTLMTLAGLWLGSGVVNPAGMAAGYGIVGLISAGAGFWAVSRARVTGAFQSPVRERVYKDKARRRSPFRSAFAAHLWLEWRQHGRLLPILTVALLGLLSVPLLESGYLYEARVWGYLKVHPWLNTWIRFLIFIPVLLSTAIGMGAARSYLRNAEGSYHLFYATRPLSSAQMLRARYLAIAIGALVSWLLTIGTIFLWLQVIAVDETNHIAPTWNFLVSRLTTEDWIQMAILLAAGLVLSLRNQMVGVFVHFTCHPAVRGLYAIAVAVMGGIIFTITVSGVKVEDTETVEKLLGVFLLLKILASIWISKQLLKAKPREVHAIGRTYVLWALAAVGGGYLATILVSRYGPSQPIALTSGMVPVMIAIWLIPLCRPIAARWALETGRHRK